MNVRLWRHNMEVTHSHIRMGDIPDEIIVTHVFPKLPAKSVLILKCVCKSWRNYISSHRFIFLHLNNSLSSNNHHLLILTTTQHSLISFPLNYPNDPTNLPLPASHADIQNIVSSCDGLICVNDNGRGLPVCVINPSTGFYKEVCRLGMPRRTLTVNFGFGFDHVNDDYKVVRLIYHYPNRGFLGEVCRLIGVYSLRKNVWQVVEWVVPFDCVRDAENGAVLNKHLIHWIVWCYELKRCKIKCFDICVEKWVDDVPMPQHYLYNSNNNTSVEESNPEKRDGVLNFGVLDGYLFITSKINQQSNQLNGGIEVWIMKEYGVIDSWSRLLRIMDEMVETPLRMTPIVYSNGRNKVLLRGEYKNDKKLCWYNLKDNSIQNAEFNGLLDCVSATHCIGSLVTIPDAQHFGSSQFPTTTSLNTATTI